ncbi:hypothetical protein QPK87_23745 [Kamptonema cortianum]|nr:hypothetical protein [Oscillatoria laete-virens]MDK3159564.1 hypothetical protein [Kamptonema cortianum]MDL5053298.1 hypothetical protein [Oscillatoria laete-virens NRMC-F 0139]
MSISLDREELKGIIKESVSELFEQNRELFAGIIEEVIEDKLFMDAMKVGESSELVSKDTIFAALGNES